MVVETPRLSAKPRPLLCNLNIRITLVISKIFTSLPCSPTCKIIPQAYMFRLELGEP
jgi:hypothetical protein